MAKRFLNARIRHTSIAASIRHTSIFLDSAIRLFIAYSYVYNSNNEIGVNIVWCL
jgi:hypothetical protein